MVGGDEDSSVKSRVLISDDVVFCSGGEVRPVECVAFAAFVVGLAVKLLEVDDRNVAFGDMDCKGSLSSEVDALPRRGLCGCRGCVCFASDGG